MVDASISSDDPHKRPDGADDMTVDAVGKLTEALEWVEVARGHLYNFHKAIGTADLMLDEVVELLEQTGHDEMVDLVKRDLIGRNVIDGRWTFQMVEDFDEHYWGVFRAIESNVRNRMLDGKEHVYESELKEERRTDGHPHHESRP